MKNFTASSIKAMTEVDYCFIVFSDHELNPTEYVMIQMPNQFDEQDAALDMDGEYFEYGFEEDIRAQYKCVTRVVISSSNIVFFLNKTIKDQEISEIKIYFGDVILEETVLKYLKRIFKTRLTIVRDDCVSK